MQVRIQSYPPLGELTSLPPGPIQLTVILEVPRSQSQHLWEVQLWRSADGSAWSEQKTRLCGPECEPTTYRRASPSVATLHYFTTLDVSSDAQFTWKFRRGASDPWTWAKDVCGHEDGQIVVTKFGPLADDSLPLPDLEEGWHISERPSQSPGTRLWALKSEVAPPSSDQSSIKSAIIGKPWGAFFR